MKVDIFRPQLFCTFHTPSRKLRLRQLVFFKNLNDGLYVLVSIECCDKFISAFVKAYMYEGFKLQSGK